jgi:UDP-N-acetyl-D-glucosamine dehydrogenase
MSDVFIAPCAGPTPAKPGTAREPLAVLGLGYVGLPLSREFCRAGFRVFGVDNSAKVHEALASGKSHIDDVSDVEIAEMFEHGFSISTEVPEADVYIICVPTPLDDRGQPDLSAVRSAAESVGRSLRPGTLTVLESTTYPGTTDEVVRPILEQYSGLVAGRDFALAFSPERIDPGNRIYGLSSTPKVVGGYTPACAQRAENLYSAICSSVVKARGTKEAEMAKLIENTYRQVNIALVNEMAILCHETGIDLRDAIQCASTKPFGFQAFHPGPGVGGHCIPVDPEYLSYEARRLGYPLRLIEAAREINDQMPAYVVSRLEALLERSGGTVYDATVILLGVTYKENVSDLRGTPATEIVRQLRQRGAAVSFHDPHISAWSVDRTPVNRVHDLEAGTSIADATVLLQGHRCYTADSLHAAQLVLDARGILPESKRVELL